jgi:hypothetical protein
MQVTRTAWLFSLVPVNRDYGYYFNASDEIQLSTAVTTTEEQFFEFLVRCGKGFVLSLFFILTKGSKVVCV